MTDADEDYDALSQRHLASIKRDMRISLEDAAVRATHKVMKEEWLFQGAFVPVNAETTAALVAEIKRLIDVVGGMALAQPDQKPVAWGVFDGPNLHDMFFTEEEAQDMARLKGDGSVVQPLCAPPPLQPEQDCVGWFGYDTGLRLWFETIKGDEGAIPLYKARSAT